jgi:non-canonical (house-cleaning) NTP pyrophosphatase
MKTTKLKVVLGTQSQVKQVAVNKALQQFGVNAVLIAVKASSNVSEQPLDNETIIGAQNRAEHAAVLVPDSDFAIAIESGIFSRGGRYLDIAIVVARLADGTFIQVESDGAEFPAAAVQETIRRGTKTWTIGKILAEWGLVVQHDDPHKDLVGKSRSEFINEAVLRLLHELRIRGII